MRILLNSSRRTVAPFHLDFKSVSEIEFRKRTLTPLLTDHSEAPIGLNDDMLAIGYGAADGNTVIMLQNYNDMTTRVFGTSVDPGVCLLFITP